MRHLLASILISLVVFSCGPDKPVNDDPVVVTEDSYQVISLSDIHFDPFFDKSLYNTLESTDITGWDAIFKSSSVTPSYLDQDNDNDTNWFLFTSTLDDLKARKFKPPFVILTGDLLLHRMQTKFPAGVDAAEKLAFTVKTMDYVYQKLEEIFPDTPIYAALGNNDNFEGNYSIEPKGKFLNGIASTWYRSLKDNVDSTSFFQNFLARGHYVATLTSNPKHKILSLNSILFYDGYPRKSVTSGSVYTQAIEDQFTWLENQLKAARKNSEKVWLIYHIPPGLDTYQTARDQTSVYNWSESSNKRFLALVTGFQDVITGQFGGHTHKDSFAIVSDTSTQAPISFIHTTPSISMSNGNYPGYHHMEINTDFEVVDFDAYYLKEAQTYNSASWEKQYSFLQAYGISDYSPSSLEALRLKLNTDTSLQQQYINYFNVSYYVPSAPPNISQANWKVYSCAIGHQDFDAFKACWKAQE